MSPPIYTPDGSEVSEIVLPDGSTASQVIGPDGNVVFEAGPDIPDAQNLLIDWNVTKQPESDGQTIDPLVDQQHNNDATAVNTPTMDIDGFNNEPAAQLTVSDIDFWELSSISISQPFTTYSVIDLTNTSSNRVVLRDRDSNFFLQWGQRGTQWNLFAGNSNLLGSGDSTVNLLTTVADGADSLLEEDGSQTASGDAGSSVPSDLGIGHRTGGGDISPFGGYHVRHLIYDTRHDSATRSDVTNYLSNQHGLGL